MAAPFLFVVQKGHLFATNKKIEMCSKNDRDMQGTKMRYATKTFEIYDYITFTIRVSARSNVST